MSPEHKGKSPRREQARAAALRFEKAEPEAPATQPKSGEWKRAANRQKAKPAPATTAVRERPGQADPLPEASAHMSDKGDDTPQLAPPPAQPEVSRRVASGQVVPKSSFRQQSKQAKPSERLHHEPKTAEALHSEEKTMLHQEGEAVQDVPPPKPKARPKPRPQRPGESASAPSPDPAPEVPADETLGRATARVERREEKLNRATGRLERQRPIKPPGPVKRAAGFAGRTVHGFVHTKLYEVEHENVGAEGAHRAELVGEVAGRKAVHFTGRQVRAHPQKAVQRAQAKLGKAQGNLRFQEVRKEHPELEKNALARSWRKHQQRKRYQKQVREAAKSGAKAAKTAEGASARVVGFIKRHPGGVVITLLCVLLIFSLQSCVSSVITLGNGMAGGVGASTYPAEDADLLGAEAAYAGLEADLQNRLNSYEATHSYDEYHYDLDEIEHDPYVLLSILSSLHDGEWTLAEVEGDLQALFDRQYILTESVRRETRYTTEIWTDAEGNIHRERVPYSYYICTVTLENTNLSHLPVYMMGEAQLSRYALYMAALGNRPDLFPTSDYVDKYITSPPAPHEVPEGYLSDPTFAAMLTEAERYLGYPYVWGGSSPATSFDCSGFISWVANQSGWNIGRLGATGLYNICTPTRSPRPGDIVFFAGTFDAPGITHCGLYVGDGWMLHCGDPIQYTDLNTSYWQAHYYAYGRLP